MAGKKPQGDQPIRSVIVDYGGTNADPSAFQDVAFRPVYCAKHHFTGPFPCDCPPGPAMYALVTDADEGCYGGSRGGMKTETAIGWIAFKGNPDVAAKALAEGKSVGGADAAYYNHSHFRGLVLRKNLVDAHDWIERAGRIYAKVGAVFNGGPPPMFIFPSGAKIIVGHLDSADAYEKYQGQEYHRMLIEEATQISRETLYLQVRASCRSKWPELRPQVFLTANPGGVGHGWMKARFIDLKGPDGKPWPVKTKWTDPETGATRIFIPARVTDNPYLMRDRAGKAVEDPEKSHYVATNLAGLPPHIKRAWLDGDWNALAGTYFKEFRPEGPLYQEESNARHVVKAQETPIPGHWHRWIGADWGYIHPSAVYWNAISPEERIFMYRELVADNTSPEELGAQIARMSQTDLATLSDKHLTLFLSPDAFSRKEGERTVASQIAAGIQRILGPKSAFAVEFTESERELPNEQAWAAMNRRRVEQRTTAITIDRASNERVAGWMFMRDLMRWKPIVDLSQNKADPGEVKRLMEVEGALAVREYLAAFNARPEVLPRLQILDCCPHLIRCLQNVVHKEGTEDVLKADGDDPADAARYSLVAVRNVQNVKPKQEHVADVLAVMRQKYPGASEHTIYTAADFAARMYEKKNAPGLKGFNFRRKGGRSLMMARRNQTVRIP